jgi:O-acetylserine/cysteine efflux transporter
MLWSSGMRPVPFVAASASSLVLGERFGPLRLLGMGLVLLGLAVLVTSRRPWDMIAVHDD